MQKIAHAYIVPHNFLMQYQPVAATEEIIEPWVTEKIEGSETGRRSIKVFHRIRGEFIDYFNANGAVKWQNRMIERFRF